MQIGGLSWARVDALSIVPGTAQDPVVVDFSFQPPRAMPGTQ